MRTILFALCRLLWPVFLAGQTRDPQAFHPQIPKAWNDVEVESYELPLSYGSPSKYISAVDYYAIPARTIYRSYPVYRPDKEPRGYLNWLKAQQPRIAFDSAKLKTEQDWIEAGAVVFDSPIRPERITVTCP